MLPSDQPIALYNTAKKECFGVFLGQRTAERYIGLTNENSKVNGGLRYKRLIKSPIFDFPVAVRYATAEQAALMNNDHYYIKEGYPVPHKNFFKRYNSINR